MSRKVRVCLLILCALTITVLGEAGARTYRPDAPPDGESETPSAIRVLAPFESIHHRLLFDDIAREYTRREGTLVEVAYLPQNLYQKEIGIQMDDNQLADVIICENVMMPALIGMGAFRDITPQVGEARRQDQYYAILWQNTMSDGCYYGLPLTCDPFVLFYNRLLLAERNIDVPKTLDELQEAAFRVQGLGNAGLGIAVRQNEETAALFMQLLYSTGATIRDINGEDGTRFFSLLGSMVNRRTLTRESLNWSQQDLTAAFGEGQVAMMIAQISNRGLLQGRNWDNDLGVAELPVDKKEVFLVHGRNVGISAAADLSVTLPFLEYLSSPEITARIATGMDTIPVRVDVAYPADGPLDAEFVEKQLHSSSSKGSFESWFDISTAVADGVRGLVGQMDAPEGEIAETMQDRVRVAITAP